MSLLRPSVIIAFVILMLSLYLVLNSVLSTSVTTINPQQSTQIDSTIVTQSNDPSLSNNNEGITPKADYELYLDSHPELEARFNLIGGDHVLHSNPLHDDQCRNSIIYKEDIDPISLINKSMSECPKCYNGVPNEDKIVWSRELIDFMMKSPNNGNGTKRFKGKYFKREAIRFPWFEQGDMICSAFFILKSIVFRFTNNFSSSQVKWHFKACNLLGST